MANANDNTQLGTAEVISDEYIDPTAQVVRRDPNLPQTAYKVPRSKIAVGPYGQDHGDASDNLPLPVSDARAQRIEECERLRDRESAMTTFLQAHDERVSLCDNRGAHLSHRGQR